MRFLLSVDAIEGKKVEAKWGDTLSHCYFGCRYPRLVQDQQMGRKKGGREEPRLSCLRWEWKGRDGAVTCHFGGNTVSYRTSGFAHRLIQFSMPLIC